MQRAEMIKEIDEQVLIRKAILWGERDVLAQAIDRFLGEAGGWEVIRVSKNEDVEKLIQMAKMVNPKVVILCQGSLEEDPLLPLRLLNEQTALTVVTVSLESNVLQVCSKQNMFLESVQDLLSIVETGNHSKCAQGKEVTTLDNIRTQD